MNIINQNLVVDKDINDFLMCNHCRVSTIIKGFLTSPDVNYLGLSDKPDTVSYLPSSKVKNAMDNFIDPFSTEAGRVHIKIGRLVGKILTKSIIDDYIISADVEEFVNQFKSFFDNSSKKFEIISGDDIKKSYLYTNYSLPEYGTLWKSCMRYKERQKYLKLYTDNPDVVKMLTLTRDDNKIIARALLWEVEDLSGNKVKIMDRIYTIYDSDVILFKRWSRENGYICKYYQNAKTQLIFEVDDKEVVLNLKVPLKNYILDYYPYLDTFQFFNIKEGIIYNNPISDHHYSLIQSDGSLVPPEPHDDDDLIQDDDWLDLDYHDDDRF